MTEELEKLSAELRQIADEIAAMKAELKLAQGPGRKKLTNETRMKQYQALFYMDTIENLAKEKKEKPGNSKIPPFI